MRLGSGPSWRIAVDPWPTALYCALWIRAAERIPVPAGGTVPGRLDLDPLPAASTTSGRQLAADWWRWWDALVTAPEPLPSGDRPPAALLEPPDFPELAGWPGLRQVVAARWREAFGWHNRRKVAGVRGFHQTIRTRPMEATLVEDVERSLGRPVPPFDLHLFVLPVLDGEVREVSPTRYLVPESVYTGAGWFDRLRPIVTRLAAGG